MKIFEISHDIIRSQITPKEAYDRIIEYGDTSDLPTSEIEKVIALSAWYSYQYAVNILGYRFPAGGVCNIG